MKILRPSIAMVSSLLFTAVCVFAIPVQTANAFFHKKEIAECNDENVHSTLTDILSQRLEDEGQRDVAWSLHLKLLDRLLVKHGLMNENNRQLNLSTGERRELYDSIEASSLAMTREMDRKPKFESAEYKSIRQESYNDANKRRVCSAFVEVKFDATTEIGEAHSEVFGAKPEYHLLYTVSGTSDGDYVAIEYMEKR